MGILWNMTLLSFSTSIQPKVQKATIGLPHVSMAWGLVKGVIYHTMCPFYPLVATCYNQIENIVSLSFNDNMIIFENVNECSLYLNRSKKSFFALSHRVLAPEKNWEAHKGLFSGLQGTSCLPEVTELD